MAPIKDIIFLLLTGGLAAYLCWYFWQRYNLNKALHNIYYLMGFAVLLVSGLLLIFLDLDILASPYVLTVASLIPLGISMGLVEEYFPKWKTYLQMVCGDWFLSDCNIQHRWHGHAQENRCSTLPRRRRLGHLSRTVLRQRCTEGLLLGRHRRFVDRSWRHCPRLHFRRQTTAVLQPRLRHAHPHPPALPDDWRIRTRLYEKRIS